MSLTFYLNTLNNSQVPRYRNSLRLSDYHKLQEPEPQNQSSQPNDLNTFPTPSQITSQHKTHTLLPLSQRKPTNSLPPDPLTPLRKDKHRRRPTLTRIARAYTHSPFTTRPNRTQLIRPTIIIRIAISQATTRRLSICTETTTSDAGAHTAPARPARGEGIAGLARARGG